MLVHKEEMLRMVKSEDYVGIVPDDGHPGYGLDCFPDEDQVFDSINPWTDPECSAAVKSLAIWYKLEGLSPIVQE